MGKIEGFFAERKRLTELALKRASLVTKRLFALDGAAYEDGALPRKTKELLGLAASLVLRCDDCVTYHVCGAWDAGASGEEIDKAMSAARVVGGSSVIPHLHRAFALLKELWGKGLDLKSLLPQRFGLALAAISASLFAFFVIMPAMAPALTGLAVAFFSLGALAAVSAEGTEFPLASVALLGSGLTTGVEASRTDMAAFGLGPALAGALFPFGTQSERRMNAYLIPGAVA